MSESATARVIPPGARASFVPLAMILLLGMFTIRRVASRATPPGALSLGFAIFIALVVGALVRFLDGAERRSLAAGLFGVGAAIWVEPWVVGLPHSLGSGGIPVLALGTALGGTYVMGRVAADRPLDHLVSQARSVAGTVAGLAASAVLAWSRWGMAAESGSWVERSRYTVPDEVRGAALLAALVFGAVVLALAARQRRTRARVAAGTRATVDAPGLARTPDGRAVVVPESLTGEVTILETTHARATYREEDRDRARAVLAGGRDAHLRTLAVDIQALDTLALAGAMAIATPASADLSRSMLYVLFAAP